MKQLEDMRRLKPRDFWKRFTKNKDNSSGIKTGDFHNYFDTLFKNIKSNENNDANNFNESHDFNNTDAIFDVLDKRISISEVQGAIKSLSKNKSTADNILNEYFISTCDILAGHITDIFNIILYSVIFSRKMVERCYYTAI